MSLARSYTLIAPVYDLVLARITSYNVCYTKLLRLQFSFFLQRLHRLVDGLVQQLDQSPDLRLGDDKGRRDQHMVSYNFV